MKRWVQYGMVLAGCLWMTAIESQAAGVCSIAVLNSVGSGAAHCVVVYHRDPILGRRFVTITNADHPDWPAITVADDGKLPIAAEPVVTQEPVQGPAVDEIAVADTVRPATQQRAAQVELPAVRAGQVVRLWRHEAGLQVDVSGVAEDNGSLGQRIRVRSSVVSGSGQPPQEIAGIVRGAASVEMAQ